MGNNRIVANAAGTVVQRNSYYPFGMSYGEESDIEQGKQPYKYNGKELDKMHGLNWYDSEARFYDPSILRTPTPDPKAESFYSVSPYSFNLNNPLRYIDPKGDSTIVYTETVEGGHSWISVGEGEDQTIYSYGPFSEFSTKMKSGHRLRGPGVIMKYTGSEVSKYLESKNFETDGDVSAVIITDIDDSKVREIIEKFIKGGSPIPSMRLDRGGNDGAIIGKIEFTNVNDTYGTYNVLTNNCSTFVSEVLNSSGSKALEKSYYNKIGERKVKENYTTPSGLRNALNAKPSVVVRQGTAKR